MADPDDVEHEPDHLAGGDSPRVQWVVAAVIAVLIAGAVLFARAGHHDARPAASHRETVPPGPAPTATATAESREVHVGSVYLEHMIQCTVTNHNHYLRVSLRVINLSADALELVGVSAISSNSLFVKEQSAQVARHGCAGAPGKTPMRLQPGGAAVATFEFRVGPFCPRRVLVSARVSFDGGSAGVVHADSSQLANLDRLNFVQCT